MIYLADIFVLIRAGCAPWEVPGLGIAAVAAPLFLFWPSTANLNTTK